MYAGQNYYPKLQCCVPFTPVTGSRILVRKGFDTAPVQALMGTLLAEVAGEPIASRLAIATNSVTRRARACMIKVHDMHLTHEASWKQGSGIHGLSLTLRVFSDGNVQVL